jgi:hypothetical protein
MATQKQLQDMGERHGRYLDRFDAGKISGDEWLAWISKLEKAHNTNEVTIRKLRSMRCEAEARIADLKKWISEIRPFGSDVVGE